MDRYAYVNNSPLNYVDPSGHNPLCQSNYCDPRWNSQNVPDVFGIFICGDNTINSCEEHNDSYDNYDGQQPLAGAVEWAKQNGVPYQMYARGDCYNGTLDQSCIQTLSDEIVDLMLSLRSYNPDIKFVIIGFSGGATLAPMVASNAITMGFLDHQCK